MTAPEERMAPLNATSASHGARMTAYRNIAPYATSMTDESDDATVIFVLGLLGIVFCQVCAPFAWAKGNTYVRTCALAGVQPNSLAVAGRVMGILGTVLLVLSVLLTVVMIAWSTVSKPL